MTEKSQLVVVIRSEDAASLRGLAAKNERTIAGEVRIAIRAHLAKQAQEKEWEKP